MIVDPSSFDYKKSRWQDLFAFLKDKGFDVYSPGVKTGECTSPYLVVVNAGTSEWLVGDSGASGVDRELYTIMVYVPKKSYSELEPMVQKVKENMRELRPLFKYEGNVTPSFYDDALKAHMVSLDYRNYKQRFF